MLRIIAGDYKGMSLSCPEGKQVRPTSDRARGSLFNILTHRFSQPDGRNILQNAHVLDAFAGTGALGLEALSRGARKAYFFEKDLSVLPILHSNLACAGEKAQIFDQDIIKVPQIEQAANVAFFDPPYAMKGLEKILDILSLRGWIDSHTLCILEYDKKCSSPEGATIVHYSSASRNQFCYFHWK